jgi:hypothetical protein
VKRKLSPKALYGIVAGGLLVYFLFGWFVIVGPKRSAATTLRTESEKVESALNTARVNLVRKDDAQPIAVADIFRLATAMPSVTDMPGILLELSRIAQETGIEFNSITPEASEVVGAYQTVPIGLQFDGNFYELSDFLFRLRTLVGVRRSELQASGRLFSVEMISFSESAVGFPEITANMTVIAYVHGTATTANAIPTPPGAPEGATAPTPEGTTPTAPPAGAEAAGAEATP